MFNYKNHKHTIHKCLCALILSCSCALGWADTIILKQGQSLTGDILVEKENFIYIDIGVEVLKISKQEILEYEYSEMLEDIEAITDSNTKEPAADRPGWRTGGNAVYPAVA